MKALPVVVKEIGKCFCSVILFLFAVLVLDFKSFGFIRHLVAGCGDEKLTIINVIRVAHYFHA